MLDLDVVRPGAGYGQAGPGCGQAWSWIWSGLELDMVRLELDMVRPGAGYGQARGWVRSGLDLDMVRLELDTVRPGPGYCSWVKPYPAGRGQAWTFGEGGSWNSRDFPEFPPSGIGRGGCGLESRICLIPAPLGGGHGCTPGAAGAILVFGPMVHFKIGKG